MGIGVYKAAYSYLNWYVTIVGPYQNVSGFIAHCSDCLRRVASASKRPLESTVRSEFANQLDFHWFCVRYFSLISSSKDKGFCSLPLFSVSVVSFVCHWNVACGYSHTSVKTSFCFRVIKKSVNFARNIFQFSLAKVVVGWKCHTVAFRQRGVVLSKKWVRQIVNIRLFRKKFSRNVDY